MTDARDPKRRAVVFVTDHGFLVPSLVAAEQVARQASVAAMAEIYVITLDFDDATLNLLRQEFAGTPIRFANLTSVRFLPPQGTHFNKTHVPQSTLGRFALHEALPEHIEHVLYLDGDILVVGDIGGLVAHDVAPGHILASNDYLWLCEGEYGKFWPKHRAYLDALGVVDPVDYFNAGVLAFRLSTWREMAPKALAFFVENATAALYHDQSALNAVFHGRREVLSPQYNFITNFADFGFERAIDPAIIHFTGGGKPWFYNGLPWKGRFASIYADFLARHPTLRERVRRPPPDAIARTEKLYRSQWLKARFLLPWRHLARHRRLRRYLSGTAFKVGGP